MFQVKSFYQNEQLENRQNRLITAKIGTLSLIPTVTKALAIKHFGPRVYSRGSYVISHVCPSVSPSLNISETTLRIFLIFCMKLGHHKGTKVTEPDF